LAWRAGCGEELACVGEGMAGRGRQ
jgi:hypothetical protein